MTHNLWASLSREIDRFLLKVTIDKLVSRNQDDADNFATGAGIGGFFPVGDRNSFSYGYAYSESKNNRNLNDTTADETNSITHSFTLGHDFIVNQLITTSIGLGYSDADAKVDAGNDYETYDVGFGLNFAFPWAYIAVSNSYSLSLRLLKLQRAAFIEAGLAL